MKTRGPVLLAALSVSLLMLTACAGENPPATIPEAVTSPPAYSEALTVGAFQGVAYDYEPFRSTSEMAEAVPLVIEGQIGNVQEGRTTNVVGTDTVLSTSIVLVLTNSTAVRGKLPEGDGNLYVELLESSQTLDVYMKAFPEGARVVAYLEPAWDGSPAEGADIEIPDGTEGRPEGQQLYMLPPQGIALQVEGYDVVWPLVGETVEGSLDEFLPGGPLIRG